MTEFRTKATNELLGTVTDDELTLLIKELEEESLTDRDYYLDTNTVVGTLAIYFPMASRW